MLHSPLVTAWNWGAAFTALFDWEAIGAIATAAAVWFAIVEATRARRFERLRAIAILTRIQNLIGVFLSYATDDDGKIDPSSVLPLLTNGYVNRAREGLRSINIDSVFEPDAAAYLTVLQTVLDAVHEDLTTLRSNSKHQIDQDNFQVIEEAYEFFSLLERVHRTGSRTARQELKNRFLAGEHL